MTTICFIHWKTLMLLFLKLNNELHKINQWFISKTAFTLIYILTIYILWVNKYINGLIYILKPKYTKAETYYSSASWFFFTVVFRPIVRNDYLKLCYLLTLLLFFVLPFQLWNTQQTVCLVIYETKEIPNLYFSNQTPFDLKSVNEI